MSDVRIVAREHVASRRAIARGDWLITVKRAADRLSDDVLAHCLNRNNQRRWWPNPHAAEREVA